ncbi:MAG TPA: enoyl-CoA hydratase/isomerase family protein [Opitutaceae bacterium]|jgi:methylglutaconyl-CoA hydratase
MSTTQRLVTVEADGRDATVLKLNRPEKRNALSIGLLEELVAALASAEADPAQRLLYVRGAGPAFCAGLDLDEAADPARAHRSAELVARALLALSASRLVTIAVVHGAAIAGGAGLMSACDLAVASADTRIGYPEPRRGLVAGLVMTFLRRQIRERDAREILLTGEIFSAERARDIGLLNRVAPSADAALDEARRLGDAVRQGGPQAVSRTKALLSDLWHRPLKDDLDRALAAHLEARGSAEAAEGLAAYFEKRPPRWPR